MFGPLVAGSTCGLLSVCLYKFTGHGMGTCAEHSPCSCCMAEDVHSSSESKTQREQITKGTRLYIALGTMFPSTLCLNPMIHRWPMRLPSQWVWATGSVLLSDIWLTGLAVSPEVTGQMLSMRGKGWKWRPLIFSLLWQDTELSF